MGWPGLIPGQARDFGPNVTTEPSSGGDREEKEPVRAAEYYEVIPPLIDCDPFVTAGHAVAHLS